MKSFDHVAIEKKWQKKWQESGIYNTPDSVEGKKNRYMLVEFPYPSGNLHVGHWYAFSVPDIFVRFSRMQGENVMYPIGFDSFGLPAENAAIKRNLDPKKWTYDNIDYMTKQLESMGNAFDWSRKVITSDPEYYKWTQWLFLQLYKNDLAYKKKSVVPWCDNCKTVLANEQIISGACERCGTEVTQKDLEQWFFKITNYADRLVDDLNTLDWPQEIKEAQREWIGRSTGATLSFETSTGDTVSVFTTRPDTLYGATYLVLSPEHECIEKWKGQIENWDEVVAYQKVAARKKELERREGKEKTGVALKGVSAINPATKEAIPVWIADYVLAGYGTGSIMAVPAHDERDYAFAKAFGLPIIPVIRGGDVEKEAYTGAGDLINSGPHTGTSSDEAKKAIIKAVGGEEAIQYRLRDWLLSRQRYWGCPIPVVYDPEGNAHPVRDEHLPWKLPEDVDFTPTGEAPLARSKELKERTEKLYGKGWTPEVDTMDTFVDSSWYFLRYVDPHNDKEFMSKEKEKLWMPVSRYSGGAEHTTMHVLYSRFFQKALFDLGLVKDDEPYTHRMNRGLILGPDGAKMSKSKGNVIDPDEHVRTVGADTVKMYLAFIGPFNEVGQYPWDMGGIAGIRRFLERVWTLKDKVGEGDSDGDDDTMLLLNQTIKKVGEDVGVLKFNTAISQMMVCINALEKKGQIQRNIYETFIRILAPFAPHLTEELWEALGHKDSIHIEQWPTYDKAIIEKAMVTIVVQVNGKTRGTFEASPDCDEETLKKLAKEVRGIDTHLSGKNIVREIVVPRRLVNIVVK